MKINIQSVILLTTCLLICNSGWSQLPQNAIGQNPLSIQWKQINTERVQVIFPEGLDTAAQRVANIIHYLWDKDMSQVSLKKHKVPILLHSQQVASNGFVTVGPFRSEWFAQAPQFNFTTHWVDHLAIHEYRHVQQLANASQGITNLAKKTLGSWIFGGFLATALPRWYLEGDAVIGETGMTKSGRGRFPEFNQEFHAIIKEGKKYSYEKAGARSLKDFVPNWYPLGYHMMSYGREKYGANLWQKTSEDAVKFKGLIFPFAKSLKKQTGLSPSALYDETMEDLKNKWASIDALKNDTSVPLNDLDKSTIIHYNAPQLLNDGSIAAIKSGYNQLNEIVWINPNGVEGKITEVGRLLDMQLTTLSHSNGVLCWSEQGFHPRWNNETYSEVMIYDLKSKKKKKITSKGRYYAPTISPDGSKIAAIYQDKNLISSIHILDLSNGEIIAEKIEKYGVGLSYPTWINNYELAYINTINQKNFIAVWNVDKNKSTQITEGIYDPMSHLSSDLNGNLYFSKPYNEISEIFSLNLETKSTAKISDASIGAFQPMVDPKTKKLYYSEFSTEGYNIKVKDYSLETASDEDFSPKTSFLNYTVMEEQEGGNILDDLPAQNFNIKDFSPSSGLLDFHSLIPEWTPPEVSLSLLSDNVFGTLSASIKGEYNYNEETFGYGVNLKYAALYPIIDLDFTRLQRSALFYNFNPDTDTSFIQNIFVDEWNENRLTTGITLPYNFSSGNMSNRISLRTAYQFTAIKLPAVRETNYIVQDTIPTNRATVNSISSVYTTPIDNENIHSVDLNFNLSMLKQSAIQHLRPRFGFVLNSRYRANIGSSILGGNTFYIRSLLFLPGLSKNHSLSFDGMFQKERILDNYRYGDAFQYPRGYDFSLRRDKFFKVGVNYRFPIAYPDIALGGFAFIKRLKGNLFFDYGQFEINAFPFQKQTAEISSTGFEFGIDFRALRLLEVDLGVRYSYLLNAQFAPGGQRHQFDFFVISVSE